MSAHGVHGNVWGSVKYSLNDLRISQFENKVRVVKGNLIGGRRLVFILHWIIYSVKRGEPEGTLGSHIGLPIMW
jgi:hypothetical protein